MKKLLLFTAIILSVTVAKAQNIETIKFLLSANQFDKAREEVDKAMGNAKFAAKPEAWMMKTSIYAALAMSEANRNTPKGDQLLADAVAAFTKYKEMDKEMKLMDDPLYQNGPANIYSAYYGGAYNDYKAKNWESAFGKIKKTLEYSDLLIARKILDKPMDTDVVVLAAIVADQANHKEEAAGFYKKLADANLSGPDFESVYRYLVSYYFGKKDIASFEKYKAAGAKLYPNSEFFQFDKVDFAVGLVNNLDEKIKAVEEVLATDPANFKANQVMGEIIYDALNPEKEETPIPANAAELETKMITAFNKAAAAKPDSELPFLYIGDHFINKAVKVDEQRTAHTKDMQARTKPGSKSSPEDLKKRDDLDKLYSETLDGAREPYTKACDILAARAKANDNSLDPRDKQQYKKAASYLGDIYTNKRINAKGKPADQAKYAAEEKKWADLYEAIAQIKDKKRGS